MIFLGQFISSCIIGKISDNYGRRKPYLLFSSLMIISSLFASFTQNFRIFLITRFFFGFNLMSLGNIGFSYLAEICPKAKRGIYQIIMNCMVL